MTTLLIIKKLPPKKKSFQVEKGVKLSRSEYLQVMFEEKVTGSLIFPKKTHPSLRSLICGMLAPNPFDRFTAHDILTHEWFSPLNSSHHVFIQQQTLQLHFKHSSKFNLSSYHNYINNLAANPGNTCNVAASAAPPSTTATAAPSSPMKIDSPATSSSQQKQHQSAFSSFKSKHYHKEPSHKELKKKVSKLYETSSNSSAANIENYKKTKTKGTGHKFLNVLFHPKTPHLSQPQITA